MSQAEIHSMILSKDRNKKEMASSLLGSLFSEMPDKEQAWQDLYKLMQDEDSQVRWRAAIALESAFCHIPNTILAWQSLRILTQDKDIGVRRCATGALEGVISFIPDKDQAWQDLMRLIQDKDESVRFMASSTLGTAFYYIQNKTQAWRDLQSLILSEDYLVRRGFINALEYAFPYIPDKDQAWQDLHQFTFEKDYMDRRFAITTIASVFCFIPDKDQAWRDIQRLIQDKDECVRRVAAGALASAFIQVPDKNQAGKDLQNLVETNDWEVRLGAISALGLAFPYSPDKAQAWEIFQILRQDENGNVRSYAYFALGRACIFKATEVENDKEFKTYIEEAIDFFERSAKEVPSLNPAAFCLPFYKSLFSLLFTSASKDDEIQRYLVEARQAIIESESKEILLEAVENLSKALQEVRSYTTEEIVSRSKAYTRYCIQAAECLREVNSKAPYASKIVDAIAVEKGIIILDDKIKNLFKEVEVAAKDLCMRSRGSPQEGFDRSTYEKIKSLSQVESPIDAELFFEDITPLLEANINRLPVLSQTYYMTRMKSKDTVTLKERYELVKDILQAVLIQGENDDRYGEILKLLRNIEFSFSRRQNLSSTELRLSLNKLQTEINNINSTLQSQGKSLDELGLLIKKVDIAECKRLERIRDDLILAIESSVENSSCRGDIDQILKGIQSLKLSRKRDVLGLLGDISSIVGLGIAILTSLTSFA